MAKGIIRLLRRVREGVENDIRGQTQRGGSLKDQFFASGLAGEGYDGGYRDAIDDVLLALNGVTPRRNGWWRT